MPRLRISALALMLLALPARETLAQAQPSAAQQPRGADPWRIVAQPQSSLVFARDGSLMGQVGREWRVNVALRSLPLYVPQAFVAIEDHRFYQHNGVDVVGIAGALRDNVMGARRGASTITQQLVGNMHPDLVDRRDRTVGRKIREQAAALEMEKRYSKEQILEAYLNQIAFGNGWFGIESAARHYFGKPASRLTLAEAASLASLPKGPALYDPAKHPQRNRDRRNVVLDRMVEERYITAAQATAAKREPVQTVSRDASPPSMYAVDWARRVAEREGVPVASGGYRIYTTVDPAMQRAAVDALMQGIARVEQRPGYRHPSPATRRDQKTEVLQGVVVAMSPVNGDVLALVGGREWATAPYNRAILSQRQPGSAIKPLLFAAAVEDGWPASELVADTAIAVPLPNGRFYRPDNADNAFLGPMTLRTALARSRNTVAVELGQAVGMDRVSELSRAMGIASPMSTVPSSAIGASVVRPVELVASFTAFANLGEVVEPRIVSRIEDAHGRVVWSREHSARRPVIDSATAFIVRDMMREAVENGTGTAARQAVPARVPVAGKTGTTNDNSDVWFVGLTPEVVAGVWLGFDTPKTIAPGAGGGSLAAPIWGQMIGSYYRNRQSGEWAPPEAVVAVEIDRATGLQADDATPSARRYTEYFIPGTEPGADRTWAWRLFESGPLVP